MDDYVASYDSEEEAIRVTNNVIEVHRRGGFTLRKFVSSSGAVLAAVGGESKHDNSACMQLDATSGSKILGMRWSTDDDAFYFELRFPGTDDAVVNGTRTPTKRQLLSITMSVYDPFGYLAEFMLPMKLAIQALWRCDTGWDDPVPTNVDQQWQQWRDEIPATARVRISRCYSPAFTSTTNLQLHVFADASEVAFAAAAYWRIGGDHTYELAFVAGKTRCAPIKQLSVPRLELQAAVLAARLAQSIQECHELANVRTVMWSDSRTVLHWIRSKQRNFKPFVAHRAAEIVDRVGSTCWRWVPTEQNVADDATRVSPHPRFNEGSRWLRGPAFLLNEEELWPTEPKSDNVS